MAEDLVRDAFFEAKSDSVLFNMADFNFIRPRNLNFTSKKALIKKSRQDNMLIKRAKIYLCPKTSAIEYFYRKIDTLMRQLFEMIEQELAKEILEKANCFAHPMVVCRPFQEKLRCFAFERLEGETISLRFHIDRPKFEIVRICEAAEANINPSRSGDYLFIAKKDRQKLTGKLAMFGRVVTFYEGNNF